MAPRYLSAHHEDLGSGGKLLRGHRQSLQKYSPYSRPLPSPVDEKIGRKRDWLRSITSGLRKLFLSIVGSEDCDSSQSDMFSDHSSEEFHYCSSNEHDEEYLSDDVIVYEMKESAVDKNMKSLSIVPKSEIKLVIEQLLMQEIFSRDECSKLVKVIQSRSLDTISGEFGERTLSRNIYGTSYLSSPMPSSFSPRCNSYEPAISDLRNKALMEAKKWFEEKNASPSYTSHQKIQTYASGDRLNPYGFEGEDVSPIEMAKSYMQSLTPSTSQSNGTICIKTPSSHLRNNSNFEFCSLSTSEAKKKDSHIGLDFINSEVFHRKYLKSLDSECQSFHNSRQSKSFSRLSEREASSTIPSTAAHTHSNIQDKCLSLHKGENDRADQIETNNKVFTDAVLPSYEASKEHLQYDTVSVLPNDADMPIISDASQNVEVLLTNEEHMSGVSVPQDPLVFTPVAGNSLPETEDLQLENPVEPSKFPEYNTMKSSIELRVPVTISDDATDKINSISMKSTNKIQTEASKPSKGNRKVKMVAKHRLRG